MKKILLRLKWSILLLVIAFGFFGTFAVSFIKILTPTDTMIIAPGTTAVQVTEPGEYVLWAYTSVMENGTIREYPLALPDGAKFELSDPDGISVNDLSAYTYATRSVNATSFSSLAKVTLNKLGTYNLTVSGFDEPRPLSFAQNLMSPKHFISLFGLVGAGFIFLLSAVATCLYSLLKKPTPPPLPR
ncbi:hypothetical protein JIN85_12580 [Luteolibacter pohnpeiensis]|uniref:Uncharacterized protein n=1 Tax=Luteolibacter pohnpeiensis TaxID=454153 RepID=A0A934SC91_9BACT|nr:hypothetical protein [Luteolibacter pohnpeiensis]MBK1883254.1 hypothetical protein [Luteolibacter pohnpeiensis]